MATRPQPNHESPRSGSGTWLASLRGVSPNLQPLRVLVIDDDDNTRTALIDLLSQAGFDVWSAADETTACRLLTRLQPRVAIVEARMVCADPDGLLRCVRKCAPDTVLIATGDLGRWSELAADFVLPHPIDVAMFTYLRGVRAAS
jgi:PleD family two-component response regulator